MQFGGNSVPGLIEPIGVQIDINRLVASVTNIFDKTGFDPTTAYSTVSKQVTFNFNHPKNPPAQVKNLRFGGMAVGEEQLKDRYNLTTSDFTEMDEIVNGTYLNEVYHTIKSWHEKNKSAEGSLNRLHSAILSNGSGFQLHKDPHTTIRYHIALTTNQYCYMLCDTGQTVHSIHIPANGQVWLLDTRVLHTALNLAPNSMDRQARLRNHLIFSVSS